MTLLPLGEMLVDCRNLQIGRQRDIGCATVSFSISPGERVAVTGAAGAGKSTLLQTIAGAIPPLAGDSLVCGARLGEAKQFRIAKAGVAYIGDDRGVFLTLTIREHVELATRGRYSKTVAREILAPLTRLADRPDAKGAHLSGGERQVLALGCALARRPQLLVVDQLTQGVHAGTREQVLRRVLAACENRGMALLFADNSNEIVTSVAQRTIRLDRSAVAFDPMQRSRNEHA